MSTHSAATSKQVEACHRTPSYENGKVIQSEMFRNLKVSDCGHFHLTYCFASVWKILLTTECPMNLHGTVCFHLNRSRILVMVWRKNECKPCPKNAGGIRGRQQESPASITASKCPAKKPRSQESCRLILRPLPGAQQIGERCCLNMLCFALLCFALPCIVVQDGTRPESGS